MKRLTIIGFLLIALLFGAGIGGVANAADFDKGLEAYQKRDYETALRDFKPLAKEGHAEAQYILGFMYDRGRGVPQDYKQAAQWLRLAAKQGHVVAQYNLGVMYDRGLGVSQNYKQAAQWYQRAAEQKNLKAQYNLGNMYVLGQGVPKDNIRAHIWFNVAASAGLDEAKKGRDVIEKRMSKDDIKIAKKRTKKCVESDYKDC